MQAIVGTEKLNLEHKIRLTGNGAAPLVYLVHGRAGNYDVMWTFARLLGEQCNIIAPQAPLAEEVIESKTKGYSWWLLNEVGNKIDDVRKSFSELKEFTRKAELMYALKPEKRLAFGFSQGAALLSLLIQEDPELFKAVALLSGFVIESPISKRSELPAVFMAHGTKDPVISIELNKKGLDYLQAKGYSVDYFTEDVTHKIGVKSVRELGEWVKGFI
jgi:phospholipase/carboxylesterase